jgi:autotransporter-associated beta strand protein
MQVSPRLSVFRVSLTAWRRLCASLLAALLLAGGGVARAQTNFATIVSDGAWTWFNDPRALFHHGILYVGYVRGADGRTALSAFNPRTGLSSTLWASSLTQVDDHNVPGMQVKQDNTLLAIWARHGNDQFFSYRLSSSTNPVTAADWGSELTLASSGAGLTYANPFQLTNESGRIYNYCRDLNYNPTVFSSDDGGVTWSSPQLMIKTGAGSTRPYVKYCSDYSRRVDFLYTDAHPDNYTCSLYHIFYQAGSFYQTDGTYVTDYAGLPILHDSGQRGSVVYQYSANASSDPNAWIATGRAWCWEIAYQTNGYPVCVFQVKVDAVTGSAWSDARVYYYYARWTGTNWQKRFIAQAGRPLYNGQPDYGAGIAIDPLDVNTVYLATDAAAPFDLSSTTSVSLGAHYELWKGVTADGGQSFTWQALTTNSTVDNLRPYVPRRFGGERCVLWFRGTYTSYTAFSTSVVGLFTTAVPNPGAVSVPVTPPARRVKANNLGSLNQTTSWLDGVLPTAADLAVWDGSWMQSGSLALGTDASWAGLCVSNAAAPVSIAAGNRLTLGSLGMDLSAATSSLRISSDLAVGPGNQVWTVTNGKSITLDGGSFQRGNGTTVNVRGAGSIASTLGGFTNDASGGGGILGPWLTVGSGSTTTYGALSGGLVSSYGGGVFGTYSIPSTVTALTNYVITTAGSVAFGAATRTVNTLRHAAGASALTWGNSASLIQLVVNGVVNSGSGTLTLARGGSNPNSGVQIGSSRELVLNAASADIIISAPITNSVAGESKLVVTGSSTNSVSLTASNCYTGGTVLNGGVLSLGDAGGLGGAGGGLAIQAGLLNLGGFPGVNLGTVTLRGGIIQNGTLNAAGYNADVLSGALVSANLAGSSASLVKTGAGMLTLMGANAYGGGTVVSQGILDFEGSGGSGGVVVAGGTLAGGGSLSGSVLVLENGVLAPGGSSAGALTINGSLTNRGTLLMRLGKTSGVVTNSRIEGASLVALGGTLLLTNIGADTITAGDSFNLFQASGYGGAFTNIVPAIPGPGLVWDVSRLTVTGTLGVAVGGARPRVSAMSRKGTNLIWLGSNGAAGVRFSVLTSTNVCLPWSNWSLCGDGAFDDAGRFWVTNGIAGAEPARFFGISIP